MTLLVDTSVWSLALGPRGAGVREVGELQDAILSHREVRITGSILQETLQGFGRDPRARRQLEARLASFPLEQLDRADYVAAAKLFDDCRARGVQLSTVDAQIAAVAIARKFRLLTADRDFEHVAKIAPLKLA